MLYMLTVCQFPLEPTPWPTDGLRRASVNSFGFGGANAHVVLDDAYNYLRLRNLHGNHRTKVVPSTNLIQLTGQDRDTHMLNGTEQDRAETHKSGTQPRLFVWSAPEESGLNRLSMAYLNHLKCLPSKEDDIQYIADLAYTLSEKRSQMPWKSFAVASSLDQLTEHLEQGLNKPIRSTRTPKTGFVFTGQGAQWYAMGRELLEYPVFKESLEKADGVFRSLGSSWLLIGTSSLLSVRLVANV